MCLLSQSPLLQVVPLAEATAVFAAACRKPHHTIRVAIDGIDPVICQSIEVTIVSPRSLLEGSKAEVNVPKGLSTRHMQNMARAILYSRFFGL
jgi:hypothetical protein